MLDGAGNVVAWCYIVFACDHVVGKWSASEGFVGVERKD
jgi:hypothetical protein